MDKAIDVFLLSFAIYYVNSTNVVILESPSASNWVNLAKECYDRFGGNVLGMRDPVLTAINLTSCVGNRLIWTGTYASENPKVTPWMSFQGCIDITRLSSAKVRCHTTAGMYDCVELCGEEILSIGIQVGSCICVTEDVEYTKVKTSSCFRNSEGNFEGRVANIAALYQKAISDPVQTNTDCLTIPHGTRSGTPEECTCTRIYSNVSTWRCNEDKSSTVICENGVISNETGINWYRATDFCLSHGSILLPVYGSCDVTYTRRYKQTNDLDRNTKYHKKKIASCLLLNPSSGEILFEDCVNHISDSPAICKTNISEFSATSDIFQSNFTICPVTKQTESLYKPECNEGALKTSSTVHSTKLYNSHGNRGTSTQSKSNVPPIRKQNTPSTCRDNSSPRRAIEKKTSQDSPGKISGGAVAGISMGVVALIGAAVATGIIMIRRKQLQRKPSVPTVHNEGYNMIARKSKIIGQTPRQINDTVDRGQQETQINVANNEYSREITRKEDRVTKGENKRGCEYIYYVVQEEEDHTYDELNKRRRKISDDGENNYGITSSEYGTSSTMNNTDNTYDVSRGSNVRESTYDISGGQNVSDSTYTIAGAPNIRDSTYDTSGGQNVKDSTYCESTNDEQDCTGGYYSLCPNTHI